MPPKVHLDGRVQDLESACVPVTDHGFLFGDSIFETLLAREMRPAFAARHLARLRRSAARSRLAVPWSDREILDACGATLREAREDDAAVRIVVTRGSGPLAPDPTRCVQPRLLIIVRSRPALAEEAREGVALSVVRGVTSAPGAHGKTGNYLASVLALAEAREKGAFEAVLLNAESRVTECATSNLFAARAGTVVTPPAEEGLLEGIVRGLVLECCADAGIPVRVAPMAEAELLACDEAFITSTLKGVLAVRRVEDVDVPAPGPLTATIAACYAARLAADLAAA